MTLGQRISAILRNGALSVKEIAVILEANENSVKTTLNRHKGDLFSIVNQDGFAPSWGNSFTPPIPEDDGPEDGGGRTLFVTPPSGFPN